MNTSRECKKLSDLPQLMHICHPLGKSLLELKVQQRPVLHPGCLPWFEVGERIVMAMGEKRWVLESISTPSCKTGRLMKKGHVEGKVRVFKANRREIPNQKNKGEKQKKWTKQFSSWIISSRSLRNPEAGTFLIYKSRLDSRLRASPSLLGSDVLRILPPWTQH